MMRCWTFAIGLSIVAWLGISWLLQLADRKAEQLATEGTELRNKRVRPVSMLPAVVIIGWKTDSKPSMLLKRELIEEFPKRFTAKHSISNLEVYIEEPEENKEYSHAALNMFPIAPHIAAHVSIEFSTTSHNDSTSEQELEKLLTKGEAIAKSIKHLSSTATYVVLRSVYTEYGEYDGLATQEWDPKKTRTWTKGTKSPFIAAHSMFPKPDLYKNMSNVEWAERIWWKLQSPMSEMMQPRARYVRNVVLKSSKGSPDFAGLVVETWPSKRHMDNPFLFFAASDLSELLVNVAVMVRCVMRFTDVTVLQGKILSEYLL